MEKNIATNHTFEKCIAIVDNDPGIREFLKLLLNGSYTVDLFETTEKIAGNQFVVPD